MPELSPEVVDNVWRHWFAGRIASVGGTSRTRLDPIDPGLFKDVLRGRPEPPNLPKPITARPNRAMRRSEGHQVRRTRSVRLPPATGQPLVPQTPLSPWAQALLDDPRNSDITLDDLIDGLDHYFEVFGRVRKISQVAYNYFSRVGTPIIVRNTKVWHSWLEYPTIPNAAQLPQTIGAFLTASREEYREGAIKETPSLLDFHIFERLSRGYATSAPPGTIIFRHNVAVLGRKVWTREEEKKYPWGADTYGGCWLLGVLPDGEVRALPMHWRHYQRDIGVHHSMFKIPEVLKELHKTHDPHKAVLGFFNAILALTASALAGVQVTIRRGGLALRIGLPIPHVRRFFADRDPDQGRRRAILHLARPHYRHLADGRMVAVGEHLRGERIFEWRGCQIIISVPGIHHSSIEGLQGINVHRDDPIPDGMVAKSLTTIAKMVERDTSYPGKIPFRRGQPTSTRIGSLLAKLPAHAGEFDDDEE